MHAASAALLVALTGPASAAGLGLPTDHFGATWSALPTTRFVPDDRRGRVTIASTHLGDAPAGLVTEALASADNEAARVDQAIDEIESSFAPVQRTALEDLRQAQRDYAAAAGGDRNARGRRFATLLRQVVEGTGRSVAGTNDADEALGTAFERRIRDAPDATLAAIETTEKAWTSYRDAFERFASAMEHPDAASAVHDELSRGRTDELRMQEPAGK